MNAQVALTLWARLLIDSLVRVGVERAVICPGSRSTPFTWAALDDPRLECTSLIDERSAAFFALGQGRASGRPTLVITTSGTAAANCLPAVVEAQMSSTPLLVLTADRPPELQDCAAPQTIDQRRLFGHHTRHFVDLGLPAADEDSLRALQRRAAQAFLRSCWPVPGAVHLNAPARKPLEPTSLPGDMPSALDASLAPLLTRGPTRSLVSEAPGCDVDLGPLTESCLRARRPLLVCGAANPAQAVDPAVVTRLARLGSMVVVPEAPSQLRFAWPNETEPHVFDAYATVLRCEAFTQTGVPDLILQIGHPPICSSLADHLRAHRTVERHVIAPHGWPDPLSSATSLIQAEPTELLRRLSEALAAAPPPPPDVVRERELWIDLHGRANQAAWAGIGAVLSATTDTLSEPEVVRQVVAALPNRALLALGNSLPIREVETYCRARSPGADDTDGPMVCAQRGANGIDGVVSAAAGAAALTGRSTTVLVGDVSFLHDLGALWAARRLARPFVVVVLNNGGGRIFEQLPVFRAPGLAPGALDFWLTPHDLPLDRAGDLFGCPSHRVATASALGPALAQAQAHPGCSLVEVRLAPCDAATRLAAVQAEVDNRLDEALGVHGSGASA